MPWPQNASSTHFSFFGEQRSHSSTGHSLRDFAKDGNVGPMDTCHLFVPGISLYSTVAPLLACWYGGTVRERLNRFGGGIRNLRKALLQRQATALAFAWLGAWPGRSTWGVFLKRKSP